MKITVLTPTYNRAHTLGRLYKSLVNQTVKEFEWLIIDDGSTDNTKQTVETFKNDNKISIKYVEQENGGKHRALNNGVKLVDNELVFFVDSDDWLEKDAIEKIIKYGMKYKDYTNVAVLSFLRAYPDNAVNGPKYLKDEYVGNYIIDRINRNDFSDKAEVCYTNKIKQIPLLEIENERFISEGFLWAKIALEYDTVYINEIIYRGDYLPDGLTRNIYKVRRENPKGCIEVAKVFLNKKVRLKVKVKNMIKYIAYSRIANINFKEQLYQTNYKLLFLICYIPGILFEQYVKRKAKK